MKVAVLTLTRDRLDSTKRCFESLKQNAGCDYEHYVLDQGSEDGTCDWLQEWSEATPDDTVRHVEFARANIGISRGINRLLTVARECPDYDVIVKLDNDCELTTPDTLADIAYLVHTYGLLLSPVIRGLRQPPATIGGPLSLGGQLVDEKLQIGGVFFAAPATVYDSFRYSESNPLWGGDDVEVCAWWRAQGGQCGYVRGYEALHTTDEQQAAYPDYFRRKTAEMAA